jgi:hypothetical protein
MGVKIHVPVIQDRREKALFSSSSNCLYLLGGTPSDTIPGLQTLTVPRAVHAWHYKQQWLRSYIGATQVR